MGLLWRCTARCSAFYTQRLRLVVHCWLQATRFVKALLCLAGHFYMVQYFPVDTLTSDWFYTLNIPTRCFPCACSYPSGRGISIISPGRSQRLFEVADRVAQIAQPCC